MKQILLCTDCSENARKAIDQCLFLFQDQDINYFLLYTFDATASNTSNLVSYNDELRKEVNACLNREVNRIATLPFAQHISIQTHAVFGKTENVVQRFTEKNHIDLIVIGKQGKNYASEQLFGSTAEKILYSIDKPKLIVPQESKTSYRYKHLVLVQENELNHTKWWSTVTALSKSKNESFKLIVLSSSGSMNSQIIIPALVEKQVSEIIDFRQSNTTSIHHQIKEVIHSENPSLLHFNVKDQQLAAQLLQGESARGSVYNKIPFIVHPFHA